MENNQHHIDNFLKQKMQELHFEVNEKHWADAQRRLDEEDKKKRPFWLFIIVVTLLIGTALTALNNFRNGNTTKESSASANNLPSAVEVKNHSNTTLNQPKTETKQAQQVSVLDHNDIATTNKQTETEQQTILTPPRKNRQPASKQPAKRQPSANLVVHSAQSTKVEKSSESDFQDEPKGKAENDALRRNVLAQGVKSSEEISSTKSLSKHHETTTAPQPSASQKGIKTIPLAKEEAPQKEMNEIFVRNAVTMLGDKRLYRSPEDYQKLNPRYVKGLEQYTYTEVMVPLGKEKSDSIKNVIAASAKSASSSTSKKEPLAYQPQPSTFYLLAGIANARGYMGNSQGNVKWGFSPSLGLGYQYSFSDRMSIYLSAYMSYISHLNITEEGSRIRYSFDKDSSVLSVTRKNLLQMVVPVQFAYKLRPRLAVFGGAGLNFGLNSISIYEDAKYNVQERRFGYMSGLRFLDVNFNFGIEYDIMPQVSIAGFYQQGLFDMTKNDYFNNTYTDRNARAGIAVRYKFKK